MNNSIQDLLDLYKADNSRETTDKMAKALEVAGEILEGVYNHISYLCASKDYDLLADVELKIENGLDKIQAITEDK